MTPEQIAALAAQAAEAQDQSVETAGGDFELPAEGLTVGRFVRYVEFGK